MRQLDHPTHRTLALFTRQTTIRSADMAGILGVSQPKARILIAG